MELRVFENDVKMYGTQTDSTASLPSLVFENDVKMYGTQTKKCINAVQIRLRMM